MQQLFLRRCSVRPSALKPYNDPLSVASAACARSPLHIIVMCGANFGDEKWQDIN